MQYDFEWDPAKARNNIRKHGVHFREAATVLRDPLALSLFDIDHSNGEERWMTIGISAIGRVLVVCHTYREETLHSTTIRIYSSRKANQQEIDQYTG
jgi:hypothetical protein